MLIPVFGHLFYNFLKLIFTPNRNNRLNFKKLGKADGFTMVELIAYVSVFAIIVTIILQVFSQVQLSGLRTQIDTELAENASQFTNFIVTKIRSSDSINIPGSVFDVSPSVLFVNDLNPFTIDTYTKQITLAGRSFNIRKLRYSELLGPDLDLTSDQVDVIEFTLSDLTPFGKPNTIQMDLELSAVNPDNDPNLDKQLSLRTSFAVRSEL